MQNLEQKLAINSLPDHSRLWVYQSNRAFSAAEVGELEENLNAFVSQWAAHGVQLSATYEIAYAQFVILAVDERQAGASGCSIDSSVSLIRNIESAYQVSLLDKSLVAYLNGEELKIIPFNKAKAAIADGLIGKETIIFNNALATVGEWKSNWKQSAGDSWMGRFFN